MTTTLSSANAERLKQAFEVAEADDRARFGEELLVELWWLGHDCTLLPPR